MLYESELKHLEDKFAPEHVIHDRRRPLLPWFDADCRSICRTCRKLERRYRRSRPTWIGNPGLTRYTKSTPTSKTRTPSTGRAVFHATVPTQQSCGSRCRSFSEVRNNNALLQATPHTAVTFLKFFRDKVQAVRSGTGNAPAPVIRQMTSAMLSSLQPDRQRRFVAWSSSRQRSPVCPIQFPRSC